MNIKLRALRHRNFSIFISGQFCALIGFWIQQLAMNWLVYRLTGSATLLGILSFAANMPILVLAPFAGLWADRFNRHRMMIATQILEMLQAIALAALAYSGAIQIWHVVALTSFLGMCIAVELPVRHSYLLELVDDREDLSNAVAAMSLMANCGRLIGPALAGLVIGLYSEATCFLINALTYIAVLISFAFIHVRPQAPSASGEPAMRGLVDGFRYAWQVPPIRFLLGLLAAVGFTAAPYTTLMPAVVKQAFSGDAQTLGFLIGAAGLGALCGIVALAARNNVRGLIRLSVVAAFSCGAGLAVLSWSRFLPLSMAMMAVIGCAILSISVSVNMILQTIVEDDKRGRVMSLYTVAFLGIIPFGGLIAGALADHIGATLTLRVGAIACTVAALYSARQLSAIRKHIQPLYERAGVAAR